MSEDFYYWSTIVMSTLSILICIAILGGRRR